MNAGIGSRHATAPGNSGVIRKTVQPNSKFPVTSFYFSCMHSARMLRSVGKNNTDCPILSCNVSILHWFSLGGPSILALHTQCTHTVSTSASPAMHAAWLSVGELARPRAAASCWPWSPSVSCIVPASRRSLGSPSAARVPLRRTSHRIPRLP